MIFVDPKHIPPRVGDVNRVKSFAFFPKKIEGKKVFWGYYEQLYLFTEIDYKIDKGVISVKKWVKIGEKAL